MSLPPTNIDISIPLLRTALQSLYASTFDAFPYLKSITDDLNTTVSKSTNKSLKDDVGWACQSLSSDCEKLYKIKSHVQFLNAEETFTTKNEIIKVFQEFASFVQMILLDDLLTTLKGVAGTMTQQEKVEFALKGHTIDDIVKEIQKFSVAFNIAAMPLKQIETNTLEQEITLSHATVKQIQEQLLTRSEIVTKTVSSLKNLL